MTTITRIRGHDDATLEAIGALRLRAWVPIVGRPAAALRFGIDEHDAGAWHCVVHHEEKLVAAGRLTVHDTFEDLPERASFSPHVGSMRPPFGLASRLVVDPSHEHHGFAELVIVDRLALASELGLTEVWGETRRHQVAGLTRHGYEVVGSSTDHSVPGEWFILRAPLGTG